MPPFVSVIIPTYNEAADIHATLDSLTALDYAELEVLVVDASKDATPEIVANYLSDRVKLIPRSRSRGRAAARNEGILAARGEIIIILNADVRLPRDFVQRVLPHYAQGADYVLVESRVINTEDAPARYVQALHEFHYPSRPEVEAQMNWTEGFSCRRSAAIAVGLIPEGDPVILVAGEDGWFGEELAAAGYRKVFDRSLLVTHVIPSDLRGFWHQRVGRGQGVIQIWYMRDGWTFGKIVFTVGYLYLLNGLSLLFPVLIIYRAVSLTRHSPRGWADWNIFTMLVWLESLANLLGLMVGVWELAPGWSAIGMRVLFIGHTYVVAENQKKLHALAAQPDIELSIITPHLWREPLLRESITHIPSAAAFAFRPTRAVWPGSEQYYWYLSADLAMRRFKPDILYVEQGAGALVYTQSLIYRNLYAPHAKAVFFTWWNLPYQAKWPLSSVERFNLSQTQGAVVGNQDAARLVREHGFNGPLAVLPQLGVDPDKFKRRDVSGLRQTLGLSKFTVGYVGRLVEEKGVRVLLHALLKFQVDFQLLIVGRGPLEDEICTFARRHDWGDKLKIVAGINQTEIVDYQNCMDVLVVPSLTRPFWKEQFGHVIIEAMACEVPVIGSDSAEVPMVIGEAGLVTPEGDVEALSVALHQLAESTELRRQLGSAARRRVLEHYTHHGLAGQLVKFFLELPRNNS